MHAGREVSAKHAKCWKLFWEAVSASETCNAGAWGTTGVEQKGMVYFLRFGRPVSKLLEVFALSVKGFKK